MVGHPEILGSLAEELHVASRNSTGSKHMLYQHHVHYSDEVRQMELEAPLRIGACGRIPLAEPRSLGRSFEDVLAARASTRAFAEREMSFENFSTLLFKCGAVRREEGDGERRYRRPSANSGNLGSVEVFPIVLAVRGVTPGIYHFDSLRHDLARLHVGDFREWLQRHVFFQLEFSRAAAILVLASAFRRLAAKYGHRGYRLALLDAGHVSQSVYLVGAALGLGVCASAGFIDDELDRAIGLDGIDFATTLTIAVGERAANR